MSNGQSNEVEVVYRLTGVLDPSYTKALEELAKKTEALETRRIRAASAREKAALATEKAAERAALASEKAATKAQQAAEKAAAASAKAAERASRITERATTRAAQVAAKEFERNIQGMQKAITGLERVAESSEKRMKQAQASSQRSLQQLRKEAEGYRKATERNEQELLRMKERSDAKAVEHFKDSLRQRQQALKDSSRVELSVTRKQYQVIREEGKSLEQDLAERYKQHVSRERDVASASNAARRASEQAARRMAFAQKKVVMGFEQSARGAIGLTRTIAMMGVMGEKDSEKLLRNLIKIQLFFDGVHSIIQVVRGLSVAWKAYTAAVELSNIAQAKHLALSVASTRAATANATANLAAGGTGSLGRGMAGAGAVGVAGAGMAGGGSWLSAAAGAAVPVGIGVAGAGGLMGAIAYFDKGTREGLGELWGMATGNSTSAKLRKEERNRWRQFVTSNQIATQEAEREDLRRRNRLKRDRALYEYSRQSKIRPLPGAGVPRQNPDGTISTEISAGVNIGGREYVIPTLIQGKEVPLQKAIEEAQARGLKNYPSFGTVEAAEAYSQWRSAALGRQRDFQAASKAGDPYEELKAATLARKEAFKETPSTSSDFPGLFERRRQAVIREKEALEAVIRKRQEDVRLATEATSARVKGTQQELKTVESLLKQRKQERDQTKSALATAAQRFVQMSAADRVTAIQAKKKADLLGAKTLNPYEIKVLSSLGLKETEKISEEAALSQARRLGFEDVFGKAQRAKLKTQQAEVAELQRTLDRGVKLSNELTVKLDTDIDQFMRDFSVKLNQQLQPTFQELLNALERTENMVIQTQLSKLKIQERAQRNAALGED